MRPFLETIRPEPDASWAFLDRRLPAGIPFEWHLHPEYELTLTLNSRGHRYIGEDVEAYDDGDLVLIGPGIPHSWCSREALNPEQPHMALVIWFTRDWIEGLMASFPEMGPIAKLLAKASHGLSFSAGARQEVAPVIEKLRTASPARRLPLLLEVLNTLIEDVEATPLENVGHEPHSDLAGDPRLARVLDHLHLHFDERVLAEDMAALACVSVSAFHRMFRRHTRSTMVSYVTRLRIGRACSLLIGTPQSIADIAAGVGYTNLSLFNRQFLRLKGDTPNGVRARHRDVMRPPPTLYNHSRN